MSSTRRNQLLARGVPFEVYQGTPIEDAAAGLCLAAVRTGQAGTAMEMMVLRRSPSAGGVVLQVALLALLLRG